MLNYINGNKESYTTKNLLMKLYVNLKISFITSRLN